MRRYFGLGQSLHLVLCLAAFGLGGCDPYVSVTGTVRDESGAAIEGATVTLQVPNREPDIKTTGPDGAFNVSMVGAEPATTQVSFRKEGCELIEQNLAKKSIVSMDVVLTCK